MMNIRTIQGIVLGTSLGLAAGIGGYTFIYAKGASYMTNDPAACANCHIMQEHFDGWMKSSHRSVAVCNDCHTPSGFVSKYATKASNGFWHSVGFTTGWHPDPLQITPRNKEITEASCRKCHTEIVEAIEGAPDGGASAHAGLQADLSCVRCHSSVGHPR